MLYRILTEDINREAVIDILDHQFGEGYTLIPAQGYWQGKAEGSLIIEISSNLDLTTLVTKAAEAIKAVNSQQAVLCQKIKDCAWLV